MFNLKQLLENVIAEAINDPQESISTDKLPSAVVIAERITKLEELCVSCFQWQYSEGKSFGADSIIYNANARIAQLEEALRNIRDYRTDVSAEIAQRSMRFYAEKALDNS